MVSEKHLGNKSTYGGVLDISLLAGRIRVTALLQFFSSTALSFALGGIFQVQTKKIEKELKYVR